ncbi:MAG: MASE1 domain-containing protein [Dokdonella sp.]
MNRFPVWLRDAMFAVGYATIFHVAFQTAHLFWYLPAGVRFAALLFSPYRRWPWLIATESLLYVAILYTPFVTAHGVRWIAVLVSNPLLAATGVWWLRSSGWSGHPSSSASMARLLASFALAAVGALLGNLLFPFGEATRLSTALLFLQITLGDYVGILAMVPLVVMAMRNPPDADTLRRWRIDIPCVLLPMLALYAALVAHTTETQTFFLSAMLGFVPCLYFTVRSGWRGAAIAVSVATVTVAWRAAMTGNADPSVEAQGLLAVAGSTCLLLGATQDALLSSHRELDRRNARLLAAKEHRDRLTADLRDAARRNLDLSEHTRRWITSELHDEIGQSLTALQTRVRLLERKSGAQGGDLAAEIDATLAHMRRTVSGLMSSLRPAGLDDFGLTHSLHQGAIRELIESNGIFYDLSVVDAGGSLDRLDDNVQVALYRIVQEAATNAVRHAHASRLCVRLRIRGDVLRNRLLLAIADDGNGFDVTRHVDGIGLQGIRDRVLSFGGRLRLRSGISGTCLQVRVETGRKPFVAVPA